MGMIINHNIAAMNAQHALSKTQVKYQTALQRLSTGLRVNSAADDAAGLGIGEKLTAQVNGLTQATSNAQNGISLVQTAEGALNETQDILQRMRELVVQAGTATVTSTDQTNIQAEVSQLSSEIDRIGNTTQYNGTQLLNGTFGNAVTGGTMTPALGVSGVTTNGAAADTYTATVVAGSVSGLKITLTGALGPTQTMDNVAVPTGFNTANVNFSTLGLTLTLNSAASIANTNATTAIVGAGQANLLVGANGTAAENIGVSIKDMRSSALGTAGSTMNTISATIVGASSVQTGTMLSSIDTAINQVSAARGNLGAIQNRLQHTINSLNVATTNMQASESQIMDADVAQETTNMVSAQILTQAGTSVLSQANQMPQSALSLLPH